MQRVSVRTGDVQTVGECKNKRCANMVQRGEGAKAQGWQHRSPSTSVSVCAGVQMCARTQAGEFTRGDAQDSVCVCMSVFLHTCADTSTPGQVLHTQVPVQGWAHAGVHGRVPQTRVCTHVAQPWARAAPHPLPAAPAAKNIPRDGASRCHGNGRMGSKAGGQPPRTASAPPLSIPNPSERPQ